MSIVLKGITKRYGATLALSNVNLAVRPGEFMTLLGPSGCGKTTLLRIVAGLVEPDEGEVWINGELVNGMPPSRRPTGMVFQNYALFPHMTVRDNISFGLRMRHMRRPEIEERVRRVAELVGIEQLMDRYPAQLSGGQQQRVALARTLAVEPSALLLDEPLAALDRKLRLEMRDELRKLLKRIGITSIFVTHDQEEALTMSDRIAVMSDGRVIQCGTPMEIYDSPQTTFVAAFVGNSNLFDGTVRADVSGDLVLEGDRYRIPLPAQFAVSVGKRITVLLRPEHLRVVPMNAPVPAEALAIPGTVSFVSHLGLSIRYEVSLDGGGQIRVETPRARGQVPIDMGARVCVEIPDGACLRVADDEY